MATPDPARMAKVLFLDSSGWIALLNTSDALHPAARSRWSRILEDGWSVVLTDWIIAETGNGLARTPARRQFAEAVDLFRSSSRARLISVTDDLRQRALSLYSHRSDKDWGLVDCASFLVMGDLGLKEAFTTDRHFKQAGFRVLLPQT
jgi:uncharacterized protein